MRIPAVAIAAAFTAGIACGRLTLLSSLPVSPRLLLLALASVLLLLFCGMALVQKARLAAAACVAICGWLLLGVIADRLAEQHLPANHVLTLLDTQRLDLKSPLRWKGTLSDEPQRLPWGYGMDVELAEVMFEGGIRACRGGMRITYAPGEVLEPLPELHAGDVVEFIAQARRPAIFRNDGAFDRRAYLANEGIHLVTNLRAAQLLERVSPAPWSARHALARVRAQLREELGGLLAASPGAAGILRAMLLGDRSFVDRQESKAFQATGTFHVIVIAGLHVSALAFFLYFCGRVLRISRSATSLLTLALLLSYVAVVEVRPPVVRATLMAAVVVLGRLLFRRLDLLNSAAVAALLILLYRPAELFDSSFQLSFLAMAFIGGLAAPWIERTAEPYARALRGWRDVTRDRAHERKQAQFRIDLRSLDHWLAARFPSRFGKLPGSVAVSGVRFSLRAWEVFLLSLVLQIGMLPMMAGQFHRIALSGPFANLVAVPVTGVIVPLGFATLSMALLSHRTAMILSVPLAWLTHLLARAVGWFAEFSRWSYRIPGPPWWLVLLFFAAFLALCAAIRVESRRTARAAIACLLLCAGVTAIYPFTPRFTRGWLEATVLDVGQGDSILVVSPSGRTMLIDGGGAFAGFRIGEKYSGPDPGEDAVSPYLWSRGFQKIDVVALTHAHQDHIGGLSAVLENFHVGSLWIGREVSSPALAALEEGARGRKIPIVHESRGAAFDWDGAHGVILWPETPPEEVAAAAQNNDSLVLRLSYGKRAILLAGDIEKQAEYQVLAENPGETVEADVLKVGHHGSRNSTTPDFLERVRPRLALISAGEENPYGHPSLELLARLEAAGVRILRTDQTGAIHVLTDGDSLHVSCFVACEEAPPTASARPQPADDDQQH